MQGVILTAHIEASGSFRDSLNEWGSRTRMHSTTPAGP